MTEALRGGEMSELKACPFCGGAAQDNSGCDYAKQVAHLVWCTTPGCAGSESYTEAHKWNRRPEPPK